MTPKNFFASPKKKKDIGVVRFHFGDSDEPYTVHMRRVKGGYAMHTPLYEPGNGDEIHFIASRTKSNKGFIGVQGKLAF